MDARETALLTLNACERQGGWSDGALKKQISAAGLDSRDAALATQLCCRCAAEPDAAWTSIWPSFSNIPLQADGGAGGPGPAPGGLPDAVPGPGIPHSAAVNRVRRADPSPLQEPPGARGWSTASSAVWRGAWSVCPPSHSGTRWITCPSLYSHPAWMVREFILLTLAERRPLRLLLRANNSAACHGGPW